MIRTRALPIVVVGALAAGGGASATTQTGLHGVVTRGPVTPMCVAELPCDEPAPGVSLVFTRGGNEIARTRSHAGGIYRIVLPAGSYTVKPLSGRRMTPVSARVVQGRMRRVDFSIDTGIR